MSSSLVSDWQELSSLYEEAVAMDGDRRAALLERLARERRALLPPLQRMLAAQARLDGGEFLAGLPALEMPYAPAAAPAPAWNAGARIGPYALIEPLGYGGMAEVWLAKRVDGAFQRQVALKLLFARPSPRGPDADMFTVRFERERDILAALDHPHIAALHDAGVTWQGQHWLALEYVQGVPITDYCDRERLDVRARVALFGQVLEAVRYAHANLVIHRDLKPDNILVTFKAEVRLLDFGIAKLMEPEGGALVDTELTRLAGRPLTPRYASPEQLRGTPLTTSCDVYSLGVVLYELLCGASPHEPKGPSEVQLEHAILEDEPRAPSRRVDERVAMQRGTTGDGLRRALRRDLDAVVLRALAKGPSDRYSSVEALQLELERWLAGRPVRASAPGAAYRMLKFTLRHRLSVGLGTAAICTLAAVATTAVMLGLHARDDAARAHVAREFVLDLFRQVNPGQSKGVDPTAREMLEAGYRKAHAALQGQPELLADVLAGIADVEASRGEHALAEATFSEVAQIHAQRGDPRKLALARVKQAESAWRMGRRQEADTLVDAAERAAQAHPDDHALLGRIAELRGWFALDDHDLRHAESAMLEALRRARLAYGAADARTVNALRGVAQVESALQHHASARRHIEEAAAHAARIPGYEAVDLMEMSYQRGLIGKAEGNFAAVAPDLDAALVQCAAQLGAHAEICASMRHLQAVVLLRLGATDAAQQLVPALLEDKESGGATLRQLSVVVACRVLAANGELARHRELRASLVELAEAPDGATLHFIGTAAALAVTEIALLEGDAVEAARHATRLLERADPRDDPLEIERARLLLGIALQMQGQHERALRELQAAHDVHARVLGADHAMTLLFGLNRAVSMHALGDASRALSLIDAALPMLRERLGPTAPVVQRIVQLRSDIATQRRGESTKAASTAFFT